MMFSSACCGDTCHCEPASSFQVDVAGVGNAGFCTVCSNFDGTYFLTPETTDCRGNGQTCLWEYSNLMMGDPCGRLCASPNGICVRLLQTEVAGPSHVCTVQVQAKGFVSGFGNCAFSQANTPNGVFVNDFGTTATCDDYSALDVPFSHSEATAVNCDWSAATVTVTAI